MAEQWETAFKSVYGKSPKKSDYVLAPKHISQKILKETTKDVEKKDDSNCAAPTRLKRPARISPMKQVVKRRNVNPILSIKDENDDIHCTPLVRQSVSNISPRKTFKQSVSFSSPTKAIKNIFAPLDRGNLFKSPSKFFPVKREIYERITTNSSSNLSPHKPNSRMNLSIEYADVLSEIKSPIKKLKEDTHCEKAFDELEKEMNIEEGSSNVIKRKMYHRKKNNDNFLKLNMKKGYHAKGKVSAEQKRKFKKKANYKKFANAH